MADKCELRGFVSSWNSCGVDFVIDWSLTGVKGH